MEAEQPIVPFKKTADKTAYMREYKRIQYQKDGGVIKDRNRNYYYKNKFGLSAEEMKLYGDLFPLISKVKTFLTELNEKDPVLCQSSYFRRISAESFDLAEYLII